MTKGIIIMAKWWTIGRTMPIDDRFGEIINGLVFECPSCIEKKESIGKLPNGKKKYKVIKTPVSARNATFRSRNVCKNLLVTVLAQIRRPLIKNGTYSILKAGESVEERVKEIQETVHFADDNYEIIVFQTRSDMSDTEALYYYIRNAFAHGSFEMCGVDKKIYKLESSRHGVISAQMRLKEETLLKYIEYSRMSAKEVKALQRPRKRQK